MASEVRLVRPWPSHAEQWLAWRNEPQGRRDNPYDDADLDTLRLRLAEDRTDVEDQGATQFRWMVEAGGQLVGTVSLHAINRRMGTAEVGYLIGDHFAGRGLATLAVRQLVDLAFFRARLRRLAALIAAQNVASQRVIEKVGFVREGVLRQHFLIEGRPVDEVAYGLLCTEWR